MLVSGVMAFERECDYSLTLFRLGFFGQSVTGGGLLGPPLCISGTNNARVMKFTHNDHLRTKKPHTQF